MSKPSTSRILKESSTLFGTVSRKQHLKMRFRKIPSFPFGNLSLEDKKTTFARHLDIATCVTKAKQENGSWKTKSWNLWIFG